MTRNTVPGLQFDTWVDILQFLAAERPDAKAFGYLRDGEGDEERVCYGELDRRARSIAAMLQRLGAEGERVLLLYPPGIEFIPAFLGCLYAGAVAVPAYPPDPMRLARSLPRLQAIAADAQTRTVLTTAMVHGLAGALFDIAPEFGTMHWLATDTLADAATDWRRPAVETTTLALLQYTSGSTGTPKGVMLSHAQLLHNSRCIQQGFGHDEQSSGVTWLPLYHDMGLIGGVLQPLYAGGPCTLLSPLDFLKKPLRWLQAMTRFRATTSGGPNFAYELCARKITAAERATLDLSRWRIAPVGAEPVRRETLERFVETFRSCGFRREALFPCYGLAESTLFVSGGQFGTDAVTLLANGDALAQGRFQEEQAGSPMGREVQSCGRIVPTMEVVIAHPESLTRCEDGRVGEIWVAGASVALGYWNRTQETKEVFAAYLADNHRGPFLRTGDLGFLRDGQLFVTGRRKDLIILHGRNLYPQDIEQTLERSHSAVRLGCTAAFSVERGGEERLAVAAEVQRRRGGSAAEGEELQPVIAAMVEAVAAEHEVVPYIVLLLPPGAIPKTSSGKIQRSACKAAFLAGELEVLANGAAEGICAAHDRRARTPLEDTIATVWQDLLNVEQVDLYDNFFEQGGHSLLATQLLGRLRIACDVDVPMRALFAAPTVAGLARYIQQARQRGAMFTLPPLRPVPRISPLPLTPGQQRLWFLEQLQPHSALYNVAASVQIVGPVDTAALTRAFAEIIRRHEVLRMVFPAHEGHAAPAILSSVSAALSEIEVGADEVAAQVAEEASRPFDLSRGPLVRAVLLRVSAQQHVLVLTLHHIIADGLSVGLLLRELGVLHAAFAAGRESPLAELPIQAVDFAAWLPHWLTAERLESQLTYWRAQLAGIPARLELPTDRPFPVRRSERAGTVAAQLGMELVSGLNALCRREGVTLFMTLLAAFQLLLRRYAGQDDIVVGAPAGGRAQPQTEELVGFFANTLVLRTRFQNNPTIRDLLSQVRETTLDADAHQDVPLERLVDALGAAGDLQRNPLFQVMFVLHPAIAQDTWPGAALTVTPLLPSTSFDLHMSVMPTTEGLSCWLTYSRDLFDAGTVEKMLADWEILLRQFVADPSQRVDRVAAQLTPNLIELQLVSSFTADPLVDILALWMAELGVLSRIRAAPPGQVFQPLLDPLSGLLQNRRGGNVVLVRLSDWLGSGKDGELERSVADFLRALKSAAQCCPVPLIVVLCPLPPALLATPRIAARCRQLEAQLVSDASHVRGVLVITADEVGALYPVTEIHDEYAERLGLLPFSSAYFAALGTVVVRRLTALLSAPYKVLVIDCDQTLWKGVVGEVGADGIEVDAPRQCLQEFLVAQHESGMLLCLCSKNNEADVAEVFERHPEMPLRREHILAQRINWRSKAENLISIARELQLGLDSFIFLDDDSVECAEVRARCPQVLTLQLPADAETLPSWLRRVWAFDRGARSQEDRQRTALYRQNVQREKVRAAAPTLHEFVASLKLAVQLQPLTETDLARVSQLTQRTNQLNCSTTRRTESELRKLLATAELEGLVVHVQDRFGDYGLVGCMLFVAAPPVLRVDTFLLSCRALGRGVEIQMLARLGTLAQERGLGQIHIAYRRSPKNQPARDFLEKAGATFLSDAVGEGSFALSAVAAARLDLEQYFARAEPVAGDSLPPPDEVSAVRRAFIVPEYVYTDPDLVSALLARVRAFRWGSLAHARQPAARAVYVAPRTPAEEVLAGIWSEVLGAERVGVNDSFFDLGGHSLLATQVMSRIRAILGVELPLRALFDAPTVRTLAAAVEEARDSASLTKPADIVAVPRSGVLPLSFAQRRLWFLQRLHPDGVQYNGAAAVRLLGPLSVDALERSLNAVIARHESLRTTFPDREGVPQQEIASQITVRLHPIQISESDSSQWLKEEAARPFDLTRGPLLRVALARLASREHLLAVTMHHIIADGWSSGVLLRELAALYPALCAGLPAKLHALPIQYADYAAWQHTWLDGERRASLLGYWTEQLRDVAPTLDLPTDRPRAGAASGRGAAIPWVLSPALSAALAELSRREGVTLFMTLLAALQALLFRYSGQGDIVVGTPVAGRTQASTEGLIGLFVNTLPLRTRLSADLSVRDLLARVRGVTLGAYAHQELPFEKLVDALDPVRDLARSPLFQVMLAMQPAPVSLQRLGELILQPVDVETTTAKFDLTLSVSETADGLRGWLEYSADLFDAATIKRMLGHYESLLAGMVAQPSGSIAALPLLKPAERQQILETWNATQAEYPQDRRIEDLFAAQVQRTPDASAVRFQDQQLSYRELHQRARELASRLRALGVDSEQRVGLCVERSLDMLVAMLGILMAGGAYVPLDPSYPKERLDFILQDSGASLLLTHSSLRDQLSAGPARIVCIDHWPDSHEVPMAVPAQAQGDSRAAAYVIYTSGSTGRPKGVVIEHRSVVAFCCWARTVFSAAELSGVLAATSICFDLSVFELFVPLCWGGGIVLVPSALSIPTLPDSTPVTLINTVPSVLATLLQSSRLPVSVQTVNLAGEPLRQTLVDLLRKRGHVGRILNLYGPSECTTYSTYAEVTGGSVPTIGRPIENTQVYVLDAAMQPVPIGIPGELYIGGSGVARGYLNRPELTAERFLRDPFRVQPGARLYKTGDQCRWLPDGNLEFLGRADQQIKLHGFRIELGEIEATLAQHPAVRDAVAILREDPSCEPRVVAYCVLRPESPVTQTQLRSYLQSKLPSYMLPAAWVILPMMPLTSSGKIDRRALPAPDGSRRPEDGIPIAPRSSIEERLAAIWSSLLHIERVGVHDNFFALGGDSILAIQVTSKAQHAGLSLSVRQVFENQTIASLAQVVAESVTTRAEQDAVSGPVVLTPIQRWFFDQHAADPHHFNQAILLEAREPLDIDALRRAVVHVVQHHDALRLRFVGRGDTPQQLGLAVDESVTVTVVDLSQLSRREQARALDAALGETHATLSLEQGPLLRVVWFDRGREQSGVLFWVIHHLVVDGVSWRILLEDLETAYRQALRGERLLLPAKTTSFQTWAGLLSAHAQSDTVRHQLSFWRSLPEATPLPCDFRDGPNTVAAMQTITVTLAQEETKDLLQQVPAAYLTEINDLLLVALVQALSAWTGQTTLRFDLEGHGRESIDPSLDLSRTVGWFTTLYPVVLDLPAGSLGDVIKSVKEQLRAIPDHGLGYGLLRYLTSDAEAGMALAHAASSQVRFNYLGQLDRGSTESTLFHPLPAGSGAAQSPRALRSHLLDLSGFVLGGRLHMQWTFSRHHHAQATIESVAAGFITALRALISHCSLPNAGGRTPSDFPLAALKQSAVDRLVGSGQTVEDLYPLSPMQQGILFHALREQGSGVYVEQVTFRVEERLDPVTFAAAWQQLVQRHPILRTGFIWEGLDEPLQRVQREAVTPWAEHDLRDAACAEQQQILSTFLRADRRRDFDLAAPPLMRMALFRLKTHAYQLVWTFHHLLLDGWSLPLLLRDLAILYEAASQGQEARLSPVRPFRDYIAWLKAQNRERTESFWREALRGFHAPTTLPRRVERLEPGSSLFVEHEAELPIATYRAVERLARTHGVTITTILQGAWALLLSRYSGDQDVVFGLTQSGRSTGLAGQDAMVGLFINTLPVRATLSADPSVTDWLRDLQARQVAQLPHSFVALADVQRWSELPRGQALFETLLVVENYPLADMPQSRVLPISQPRIVEQTNYPLTLTVALAGNVGLRFSYDPRRFDAASIRRMQGHFVNLLDGLASRPADRISGLDLLTPAERKQLLVEWNATETVPCEDRPLHALIEGQAARSPDATAVIGESEQLTYGELNRRANQLAHHLRTLGVGPDVLVGLCMDRSPMLWVALLGILKAGGAYVPLDPGYPEPRLAFLLQDSALALVLTEDRLLARLPKGQARMICLDAEWRDVATAASDNPASLTGPDSLAYVIYTSGSTGMPKGTLISQRSLVNYLTYCTRTYDVAGGRGVPVHSSLSFDLTVTALWAPLLVGQAVIAVREQPGVEALAHVIEKYADLSLVKLTPSHLRLLQHALPMAAADHTRALVIGGEALSWEQLAWFRASAPRARLLNEYGPTEATVGCCVYEVPADGPTTGSVPIGRPIANTQLYVLDAALRPLPVGVPGELYIGGAGLARGYLHRPNLTAERFVNSPFSSTAGARLYKSGDLCCWRDDGNLEFLGRMDQQIKLRGHRIEPGEIEAALMQHAAVREAVVLLREEASGHQRLVAYVLLRSPEQSSLDELRTYLLRLLPEYMVPSLYVPVTSWPLSPNGKVDRQALPPPEAGWFARTAPSAAVPRSPAEEILARIWSRVLRVPAVGPDDSFFALGGDSILAIQVLGHARQAGLNLSLRLLFQHPTLAALARAIPSVQAIDAPQEAVTGPVELTPVQRWFFALGLAEPQHFNQALLLQTREPVQIEALRCAVRHLVAHHDALRLRFVREGGMTRQTSVGTDDTATVQALDLSTLPQLQQAAAITAAAAEAQASMNLEQGPLMRVLWIDLGAHQRGRLLWVIHHLAVDGVSWRILLEDLETAYGQACAGAPLRLPAKTTSYQKWVEHLLRHAQSESVSRERPYWRSLPSTMSLPCDHADGDNTVQSARILAVDLDEAETRLLMHGLPSLYDADVSDALLTAVLSAVLPWVGTRRLRIDLEHHGRHELAPGLDLSRTVGWFTALYPAVLELPDAPLPDALCAVHRQRMQIPSEGLGYGLLRYLRDDVSAAELADVKQAEVSFNYLGQLDASLAHSARFAAAAESTGPAQSPRAQRTHRLEINSWVLGEQLHVEWIYSERLHHRATIDALAQQFLAALRRLLDPCRTIAAAKTAVAHVADRSSHTAEGVIDPA